MGKKLLLTALSLVIGLSCFCGATNSHSGKTESDVAVSGAVTQSADTTVTMRDIEAFLKEKDEHYPLSDEFIERYQQASGGYIDLAKKTPGMVVDRAKHEPNQKWHFFDSWLYPSIEDGTLTWDESAKSRVYSKLLCPELLLWIYEASGVDPAKVRAAKNVAEQGRAAGTGVSTIAKNMRACVAWEDIENSIKNFTAGAKVTLDVTKLSLTVGESATVTATAVAADGETVGGAAWSVTQGEDLISITPDGNVVTVNALAKGVAKIKATYGELSAECTVTVKAPLDPSTETSVKYTLSGTSTAALTLENVLDAFHLVGDGDGIIKSVTHIEGVYGGGSGGSGDNRWSSTDFIKLGTGSILGGITLELNAKVSRVVITGYVHNAKCEIRAGDADSTDWTDDENDGKTTSLVCSDMTVIGKDALAAEDTSVITIDFESASSVKIATVNTTATKYPIYITSIEFVLDTDTPQ